MSGRIPLHPAQRGTDRKYKATFSPPPLPPTSAGGRCALAALAAPPACSGGLPQRLPPSGRRSEERTISNGISQVQRGEILYHCAHVAYKPRWCGLSQMRIALGDNGQEQWKVEQRPA